MRTLKASQHLFIIAVIAGLIAWSGVSGLPCFADSGSGVSIQLTTTVTGNGNGSGWYDWGTGASWSTVTGDALTQYIEENMPPRRPATVPPSPAYIPPPTYSNPNPPQVTPVQGVPMPTTQSSNLGAVILIGLAVFVVGIFGWLLWIRLKPKKVQQPIGLGNEKENKTENNYPR